MVGFSQQKSRLKSKFSFKQDFLNWYNLIHQVDKSWAFGIVLILKALHKQLIIRAIMQSGFILEDVQKINHLN
jgi:hypothetical protein